MRNNAWQANLIHYIQNHFINAMAHQCWGFSMFGISKETKLIGLVGRVFANGPGDLGSIPGRVIPKTLKMDLDISLLNTQQYKVRIEGKVEQSMERSCAFSYTSLKREPLCRLWHGLQLNNLQSSSEKNKCLNDVI